MTSRRTQELEQVAYDLGLQFTAKDEWGNLNLLEDFRLFKKGAGKRIYNLMSLQSPLGQQKVQIFDYHYTRSTGKTHRKFKQTVFFVQSKELALPEFWMKPEHFFHRIGSWLGFEDIDFEEHPEFSEQYHLKGEDEDLVRDAFNTYVIHFFTIEKQWSLEGIGFFFILYQKNKLIPPTEIKNLYTQGLDVLNRLKN